MLLQFSCSNFRSIKDEITFSMLASSDNSHNERNILFNKINFERIAAIYGANGSGKSNFIAAIEFATFIVNNSINFQPGQTIKVNTHKLSEKSMPTTFSFHFEFMNIRYVYSFSLCENLIDEEYLYFFPNNRKTKIFSRKKMSITAGNKYKNAFTLSLQALQENRLFLSCAANYSRIDEIKNAFKFFSEKIVIYKVNVDEPRMNNWYEYSISLMQENSDVKSKFLKILALLDTGIKNVIPETINISAEEISNNFPEPLKKLLLTPDVIKNGIPNFKATVIYDNFTTDLINEESTGIQKLFQIICPILDIWDNDKILLWDEIETGLHEAVIHKIIELFYTLSQEKRTQLIFTTHNTSLLDSTLFRRDQIWFTQLTNERATDLYSLLEIRDVRKNENLAKGYINGKYGAIPMLSENISLMD